MNTATITREFTKALESGTARTWIDLAALGLKCENQPLPENHHDVWRSAVSSANIAEAFTARVGSMILTAYDEELDNTTGWVREIPAANFLGSDIIGIDVAARLEKLAPGQSATSTTLGVLSERVTVARFATQFVLDEVDVVNGMMVGVADTVAREIGRAARRSRLDAIFATLLRNPTLANDNTALFHADHANLGSATLSESALDAAWSAIASQTVSDGTTTAGTSINLTPRYLVVNPALATLARRLARLVMLDGDEGLIVRSENRLGAGGVIDPQTGDIVNGSATSWLLIAPASQRPCLVVASLDGMSKPRIRSFNLEQGQWGMGFDVTSDYGVAPLDYRGLFYSTAS